MLRHTSSLGVRVTGFRRTTLERKIEEIATPYGTVHIKTAGGVSKPEYEDLARIAREHDLTLGEAAKLIN